MSTCCHCMDAEPCAGKIAIFRHLDSESLCRISDLAAHKTYARGEILFSPGSSQGLFLISEGKVKVYEISPSGKEQLLRVLTAGDFVGEEALFSSTQTYTFCQALMPTRVCFIRREDFLALLMQHPSISLKLLEEFNRRMIHSGHQATSNTAESVQVRLAGYLLELSEAQDSVELELPLPMKELAAFLSTSPETLSRRLRALEESGLIARKGRRLRILQKERLQSMMP